MRAERFYWAGDRYFFAEWPHEPEGRPVSDWQLRSVLRAAANDGIGRAMLHRLVSFAPLGPVSAEQLLERVLDAARSGRLRVTLAPERVTVGLVTSRADVEEAPVEVDWAAEPTHWIEIELTDDDGNPVPHERFELVSESGRKRTGQLDALGFARVEPLDGGAYDVRFPRLSKEDCRRA